MILSGVVAALATVMIERTWESLLRGLGTNPPVGGETAGMFYVTQLGKYLPGSVWPVLAQMQFGVRWGIARSIMLAANILLLGIVTATGIVVGALLLPWSSSDGLSRYWWLLLLLVPLAVGLHPRTVPAVLNLGLRRMGREPLEMAPTYGGLVRSAGWMLVAWGALGVHIAILLSAFGALTPATIAASIGSIALGWAAGIAFIPAPAGAGVREGVLILTLGPLIGTTPAVTVALASRVLLLIVDVALAGLGALAMRRGSAARQH
jgi:hypothetical protein